MTEQRAPRPPKAVANIMRIDRRLYGLVEQRNVSRAKSHETAAMVQTRRIEGLLDERLYWMHHG